MNKFFNKIVILFKIFPNSVHSSTRINLPVKFSAKNQ